MLLVRVTLNEPTAVVAAAAPWLRARVAWLPEAATVLSVAPDGAEASEKTVIGAVNGPVFR